MSAWPARRGPLCEACVCACVSVCVRVLCVCVWGGAVLRVGCLVRVSCVPRGVRVSMEVTPPRDTERKTQSRGRVPGRGRGRWGGVGKVPGREAAPHDPSPHARARRQPVNTGRPGAGWTPLSRGQAGPRVHPAERTSHDPESHRRRPRKAPRRGCVLLWAATSCKMRQTEGRPAGPRAPRPRPDPGSSE